MKEEARERRALRKEAPELDLLPQRGKEAREQVREEIREEIREEEPVLEVMQPKSNEEEQRSGKGMKAVIIMLAVIAGLAIIGILAFYGKKFYDDYMARREAAAFKPHAPEISQSPVDPDIYRVTVYAENGSSVIYEDSKGIRHEYIVREDDRIVFEVHGSELIPKTPLSSTSYSAQPKFYTRNAAGDLVPITDMGYIMLDVPEVGLTLTREAVFTDEGKISFGGNVSDRAAVLKIDGEPYETAMDGSFVYSREYEENGEYEITVTAELPGYCTAERKVKVSVDIPEPPVIMMPWDLGETRYSQRITDPNDTIGVHGAVPAGSAIAVSCENAEVILTEPEITEDGKFSFSATLPAVGDHIIKITCTDAAGSVNTREVHLQRAPEWKPYVESAWAMSYDALTRPSKQCYNIRGTVTKIIEHIDHYIVVLETKEGEEIILEYYNHYPSANTFEEGKEYKWIYGYPSGRNSDGVPVVYVWFVNDK